jgi:hypothetical protein
MSVSRVVPVATIDYPEGPMADALEAEVQRTLPPLPGFDPQASQEQRVAVYESLIAQQRADFIEMYGCPLGWEKRNASRDEPVYTANFSALRLARAS